MLPYDDVVRLAAIPRRVLAGLMALGIVSGATSAALVAVATEALRPSLAPHPVAGVVLFALLAAGCLALQQRSVVRTAALTQEITASLRLRILERLFQAPLFALEQVDRHAARLVLSRDTVQVASLLPGLASLLGALVTVACALGYLLWLSLPVGAVVCAVIVLAVACYQRLIGRTRGLLREALDANDRAFGFVDDLLQGGRDLRLDAEWAGEFQRHDLAPSVREAARMLAEVRVRQQVPGLIGFLGFAVVLGLMAFALPPAGLAPGLLVQAMVILLFAQAHVLGIVQRLPQLQEMAQSGRRIERLLQALPAQGAYGGPPPQDAAPFDGWRVIRLARVGFSYAPAVQPRRLQLREIDLEIRRGTTVFLVGGNGSGKTTLAKVLTGLYAPTVGTLLVDSEPVGPANEGAYRGLFNAVFSDVYLFRRPCSGPLQDARHPVHQSLRAMEVALQFDADGRLDPRPYSQGQRKRVASALALLSNRPVCLFDEWTADQDPEFRAHFYNSYLPALKAAGKTVVVITHDERYFHLADLLVRLDSGAITSAQVPPKPVAAARDPAPAAAPP